MDKTCDICHGAGEFYTHTKDCQSDWCALAGGMDDCLGQVLDCPECTPTPPRIHPMQDEVKVSQADERAVAEFHRQSFETLFATTDADIDAGINRAHTLLCQAFARHRHQAERETLARMEPVAWMYERGEAKHVVRERVPDLPAFTGAGWTEHALGIIPAPEAGQ